MTISNQGDIVKYSINGTTDETGVGVVLMTPGQTSPLGSATNPIVTSASTGATLATNQISVGTTVGGTLIAAARTGRRSITIENLGTTDVFLGASGVTTTNGMLLTGTKGASMTLNTSAAVYGIVGTGTQSVSFIEVY